MTPPATPERLAPRRRRDAAETPRDRWLARRHYAWGGSELIALWTAYNLVPLDKPLPAYVMAKAEHYKSLRLPKFIANKAGLKPRPKGDTKSKDAGNRRERELLERFASNLAHRRVRPGTIQATDDLGLFEIFPLTDRRCSAIAVTPDAWARALHSGALTVISLKCTHNPLVSGWHYLPQINAEMAVMDASYGVVVVGECWVADWHEDGPVRASVVRRDEEMVAINREVAREAWDLLEDLRLLGPDLSTDGMDATEKRRTVKRRKAAGARCAELWAASYERMQVHRPASIRLLDERLEGIEAPTGFAA